MSFRSGSSRYLAFTLLFVGLGYSMSWREILAPPLPPMEDALATVTQTFHADLDELDAALDAYAAALSARKPAAELRRAHLQTRQTFKRCEYLLEYIEPESVKRYLNGAPLPKTEPKVPEVIVIDPMGLQVLDELAYEEEPDYAELSRQVDKLKATFTKLRPYIEEVPIHHRHLFEAGRQEVIRSFTLGVTGFDTPGSIAAIEEARTVMQTLYKVFEAYRPYIDRADVTLSQQLARAFSEADRQLQEADFDTFDRLDYLRRVINPLTTGLPRAQRDLGIEFTSDDRRMPTAVSDTALLFAADFLDPAYYDRLSESPYADQRRQLGELLFFDPVLSENLQMSCASCHRPELAFTDGKERSVELAGGITRNAPTLVNSVFAEKYFYDLREEHLERQVKHVVRDAHEFATDFVRIEERLKQSKSYRDLFTTAYADQPAYSISSWSISDALGHYVSGLRAFDSPFDRYARGETDAYSAAASRGFTLFAGKGACATCHFAPTFSGLVPPYYVENETEVLGVPSTPVTKGATVDPDPGRVASGRPRDEAYFHAFAFKTPTVRNIAMTAPYMHNGVYTDLQQVVDFYNRGGGKGIGIHLDHQTLPFDSLGLTQPEMNDIVEFMETLTDFRGLVRQPEELPTFEGRPEWNARYLGGGGAQVQAPPTGSSE